MPDLSKLRDNANRRPTSHDAATAFSVGGSVACLFTVRFLSCLVPSCLRVRFPAMRSFRKKVVSAVAWAVPVFAAALPSHAGAEVARPDGGLLQLGMLPSYALCRRPLPPLLRLGTR